jgi:hypothetical protein
LALDQALQALDPKQLAWVETTVWQKVTLRELTYQAEGRYLAGPGNRFRLTLRARVGDTESETWVACDGTMIRQAERWDGGRWSLSKPMELAEALAAERADRSSPDGFVRAQLAGGLAALVRDLRQQLAWVRKERVRRNGRPFIKLTGIRPVGEAEDGRPRLARLYLDGETFWPHRLEWWGADPPRPGDVLLMQLELRDPVRNRPLPPDRCATEFAPEAMPTPR